MKKKIACAFNYAPHYREPIYRQMDAELNVDFYFGDKVPAVLKAMDHSILANFKGVIRNKILLNHIVWQSGLLKLLFNPTYSGYLMTVNTSSISSWIFIYLAKLMGKEIYFWAHGSYGAEGALAMLKSKLYFLPADGLLLYGEYARQKMIEQGYSPSKLHVIANSLDYDTHLSLRKSLAKDSVYADHFHNEYPVIIFIGRLEKGKKLHMIIQALHKLDTKGSRLNAVFIGEGTDRKPLQDLAENLGLRQRVWFYGACYDEETIGQLVYNADVSVAPGNVGLTCMHSLSFGTPVITHNDFSKQMPEFEAIQAGYNGDFFEYDNLESLVDVIERWLSRYPQKTLELVKNCYAVIDQKYNPHYQIKVLKEVMYA